MNKAYYAEYYALERAHWWFVIRGKILIDRIKRLSKGDRPLQILNVGVATGRTSELLKEFGPVTSIEYDADCCEFLRKELKMDVVQGSVLDLPFADEQFDLVCAFDVIEHVAEDKRAARELARVCKTEGLIVVTVPAFMQLWSQHDVVNQHYRRYVMKGLKALFSHAGLEIRYSSYFNSFLFLPIWAFRRLSRILPRAWLRKDAGSDFSVINSKSFINRFFYFIFDRERAFLKVFRFPFGVSILLASQKVKS